MQINTKIFNFQDSFLSRSIQVTENISALVNKNILVTEKSAKSITRFRYSIDTIDTFIHKVEKPFLEQSPISSRK